MPRKKTDKFSEKTYYFRPFTEDEKEIEKQMRVTGKDKADLMREIVKAGLYHLRLTEARLDPTHQLAKKKTIEAVREGVIPTNNQLDKVLSEIAEIKKQISDGLKLNQQIDRRLAAVSQTIIEKLDLNHKGLEEVFRHTLVQRGLFYIYLLAYRAGTVFERKDISEKDWTSFVAQSVKLTSEMAANELLNKKWQDIENQYIPHLAKDIFDLIRASRPRN